MIFPHSFSGGFVIDIYSYENTQKNLSFRGFLGGKNSLSGEVISIYFSIPISSPQLCPL
jgi:hypothetical protein